MDEKVKREIDKISSCYKRNKLNGWDVYRLSCVVIQSNNIKFSF